MSVTQTRKTLRVFYSSPVAACVRQLRVFPPQQRGAQRVLEQGWNCFPKPDFATETTDEMGNRVLELRHKKIQREFHFEMTLETSRDDMSAEQNENLPLSGIGAFLLPSALCDLSAPICDALNRIEIAPTNDAAQTVEQLCDFAHKSIEYSMGSTKIETTASQSLQRGRGVCQDYAHILIALCRASGIAARYISGFNPAEGAMHAWVETLCDNRWLAFDPTHNRATRADCVFVACGRDFRDVSPHRGSFRGNARVRMQSWCKTVVEE